MAHCLVLVVVVVVVVGVVVGVGVGVVVVGAVVGGGGVAWNRSSLQTLPRLRNPNCRGSSVTTLDRHTC